MYLRRIFFISVAIYSKTIVYLKYYVIKLQSRTTPKATRRHRAHVSMGLNLRLCIIIRPPTTNLYYTAHRNSTPLLYRMEHIGALIILHCNIETTYVKFFSHNTNVMTRSWILTVFGYLGSI